MIRNARSLLLLLPFLLSFALIAEGAESKKKPSSAKSSKTTAAKSTPATSTKKKTTGTSSSTPKPSTAASNKTRSTTPKPTEDAKPTTASAKKSEARMEAKADTKSGAKSDEQPTESTKSNDATPLVEMEGAAATAPAPAVGMVGPTVASIPPESLAELRQQPDWIQALIRDALGLTTRNLGYLFGSADPEAGGMDCSGTIYYILRKHGFKDVPRDSRGQYSWLINKGTLRTVPGEEMAKFDFRALRPGDLLFWTGTYVVNNDVPISHVMLYLGTEKETGKPVMWGASDGRTYGGKQRFGVSVFDFKLPRMESKSRFVGFGQLPALGKM